MAGQQPAAFFPRADAAVLQSKHEPVRIRPDSVGPVFDTQYADEPLPAWNADVVNSIYPTENEEFAPAPIPEEPDILSHRYLHPVLTQNERLRLTMVWYYTRNIANDEELLSSLQEKIYHVQKYIGWEFGIIGVLDNHTYTRLATYGIPLAILPRRESTCSHTINQSPGTVFYLPNMGEDWRFCESPHVAIGGLKAYCGAPLRLETHFGESVALGSLCVASNDQQELLNKRQQLVLIHFADWIVADITQSLRVSRQRTKSRMTELLAHAEGNLEHEGSEQAILDAVKAIYPEADIAIQDSRTQQIAIDDGEMIAFADFNDGLWENVKYLDEAIANLNGRAFPKDRVVRMVGSRCGSRSLHAMPSFLVVLSKDFRLVFDDVDSSFVANCANALSRIWHKKLLWEAAQAKEAFLRGLTHQFRTLVHGILSSAELLTEEMEARSVRNGVNLQPVIDDTNSNIDCSNPMTYLDIIRTSGSDLLSTINSVIILNQWDESARAKQSDTMHSVAELESQLSKEIEKAISGHSDYNCSVFFHNKLPANCDNICISPVPLRNCLIPLILNGIQNTPPHGIVCVTMSMDSDLEALVVDVVDTGCGIEPESQERIFAAYEKINTHSTGPGLGLTLASKFASLLNGSVEIVSSQIDQGSHFRASFSDVTFACSRSARQMLENMRSLPRKFHQPLRDTNKWSLSNLFVDYLIARGFSTSDTPQDCIHIYDYTPDTEQLHKLHTSVPSNQVGLCLIPSSIMISDTIEVPMNVVYVTSPFLSNTLTTALAKVDEIYSNYETIAVQDPRSSTTREIEPGTTAISDNASEYPPNDVLDVHSKEHHQLMSEVSSTLQRIPQAMANRATSDDEATTTMTEQAPIPVRFRSFPTRLSHIAKPRALLVDDNVINLRILRMYCTRRHFPYTTAEDGFEAVTAFSKSQQAGTAAEAGATYDLIFMDLQMPRCDGIEATRQIRALEKAKGWKRSVIFMVTGQDTPQDRSAAEIAGVDGYFVKPLSVKLLDSHVQKYFCA